MEEIESQLKLKVEWKGAPQPIVSMKCAATVCADELESSVNPAVFSYFEDAARNLIQKMGAEKALCAALAKITGQFCDSVRQCNVRCCMMCYFAALFLLTCVYVKEDTTLSGL